MKKKDNKAEESKDKGRYRALSFIKGPTLAKEKDAEVSENELPTWPYLVRKEFLAAIICTIILIVWSILLDAPLEELSDPTLTPNPAKAPWYFLGLQEMLVYFDPWIAGVVFPTLIIIGLMAIPYIDFNPKGNGYYTLKERKFAMLTFCFGFHILWILLIIVYFFMGMNIPYLFMKTRKSTVLEKLGIIKYSIVAFLFLSMMALPIKVFLRLVFHIKYIWVTPWFNI